MNYAEASKWIKENLEIDVSESKLRRAANAKRPKITHTRLGHSTVQITEQACRNFVKRFTKEAI